MIIKKGCSFSKVNPPHQTTNENKKQKEKNEVHRKTKQEMPNVANKFMARPRTRAELYSVEK